MYIIHLLEYPIPLSSVPWAPEGREGRYQAGPKGRSLEVRARRAPRLLVSYIFNLSD